MPLPQVAVQALRDHHRAQAELKLRPVRPTPTRTWSSPRRLARRGRRRTSRRAFRTFKARHGYEFRFHDLRHTHASLLLAQGAHVKVVQERLGHASVTMTMDTYSHLLPGVQEAAVDIFDAAMAKAIDPAR